MSTEYKSKSSPRTITRKSVRAEMEASQKARWELENDLTTMALHLGMVFLTTNGTKATFADNDQVYLYEVDPRYRTGRAWTPGRCIATLVRQDLDTEDLHAMAKLLTPE